MSMVRASALSGYRELVAELGGHAEALLERFHIADATLDEPQAFVSYNSLIRLLEESAKEHRCPDFGLRLSTRQDLGILGPLGVAVRNCESLGDAMVCASRYMFVHSPAISFSPQPLDSGRVLLAFAILLGRTGPAVQVTELSVGLAARIVAMLSGSEQSVRGVHFRHARRSSVNRYWSHFHAPVTFNAKLAGIELERTDLRLAIHDASVELRQLAEDYLHAHHDEPGAALSSRVRQVIQRSLGTGASSCVDVASAFALHPRTLQRQLRREGTTFEQLKDDVRAKLARDYVANRDLPLSHVAALLDYSEQSALTRSFKRWFGSSPRRLRATPQALGSDRP
jgi:AraC-like DNA-binding protein